MKFSKMVCVSAFSLFASLNAFAAPDGDFFVKPAAEIAISAIQVDGVDTSLAAPAAVSSTVASEVTFSIDSTVGWEATTSGCDNYNAAGPQTANGLSGVAQAGAFNIQFVGATAATSLSTATCTITVAQSAL